MNGEDTVIGGQQPNAANPAQVKASTKAREWKTDEQTNDLRRILQLPEGQRFIIRLLEESRVLLDPFNRDPIQMAHDVGFQAIGRTLITWLGQADPAAYPRILLQRLEEKKQADIARQRLVDKETSK